MPMIPHSLKAPKANAAVAAPKAPHSYIVHRLTTRCTHCSHVELTSTLYERHPLPKGYHLHALPAGSPLYHLPITLISLPEATIPFCSSCISRTLAREGDPLSLSTTLNFLSHYPAPPLAEPETAPKPRPLWMQAGLDSAKPKPKPTQPREAPAKRRVSTFADIFAAASPRDERSNHNA